MGRWGKGSRENFRIYRKKLYMTFTSRTILFFLFFFLFFFLCLLLCYFSFFAGGRGGVGEEENHMVT